MTRRQEVCWVVWKRHEGSFTGSDVLYVELTEPITTPWLQWALIEAGEPANIHKL